MVGTFPMKRTLLTLLLGLALLQLAALAVDPAAGGDIAGFNGRWRMDTARSTALDGWTAADVVITTERGRITFRYDMTWHATKVTATNVVTAANVIDTPQSSGVTNFFRIDQRHMAVYARPGEVTAVTATWLDSGRTLRVEAQVPVEISQGNTTLRLYQEYRLLEGGNELVLIELHSTRDRPLVYHFTKVPAEAATK